MTKDKVPVKPEYFDNLKSSMIIEIAKAKDLEELAINFKKMANKLTGMTQ